MGPNVLEGANYKNKKYYNKKRKIWTQLEDIQTQMKESRGASQFLANYITFFFCQPAPLFSAMELSSIAALEHLKRRNSFERLS